MARRSTLWFLAAGGRDAPSASASPQPRVSSWILWPQCETPQSSWLRTVWGTSLALDLIMVVLQATIIGVLCGNETGITLDTSVPLVQHVIHLAMSIYNFALLWDALHRRNFPQLVGTIIMHITSAIYAILQAALPVAPHVSHMAVHDTRIDQALHAIKIFNATVVSVGAVVLASISRKARGDFGWRVFKHLGADPRLKRVYAIHHSLLAAIKINLFYFIIYLLQYGLLTEISAVSAHKAHWIDYDAEVNPLAISIIVGAGMPLSVLSTGLLVLAVVWLAGWLANKLQPATLSCLTSSLSLHASPSDRLLPLDDHYCRGIILHIPLLWHKSLSPCGSNAQCQPLSLPLVRRSELPKEILPGFAGHAEAGLAPYPSNRVSVARWSIE
ncbi:hypothetical protein SYNPS1DRAFT_27002 [Syncephalis pseudoplumigaleata]|uniref:Uncharacterized protein n=1 Tax=Syncephalis pseudoplumigaleata TaxID=1712513 RepID=A0A4V1J251_9FUNG|nr:hypothetical protein SYNPS1DRAFT_27002 [Syncephalis pseudoplumigaleata]|eukprot:RKP27339.1 hypothetical protein SYNPS1DRAFT_27002 [Syncephalis pseudoplumigaleata]